MGLAKRAVLHLQFKSMVLGDGYEYCRLWSY